MPKVKTHKGTSKRIRKTKTGKLMARATGQNHFNSRESGNTTKNKRRDLQLGRTHRNLLQVIPYK